MLTRSTVIFTGTVQGVGFRYTTQNIARNFQVSGWVRNEPDGSVKCVIEGDADEVERFIAAIQRQMSGHIRETRIESSPVTGEHRDFFIAR